MRTSKFIVSLLLISMLSLTGCQSISQQDYERLQNELEDVKRELEETEDELELTIELLQTIKLETNEELLESIVRVEINNKEEKIQIIDSSLELLATTIKNTYPNREMKEILDAFIESQSIDIDYVYFGTVNDEFTISPIIELPNSYRFTERPPYTEAVEKGTNIAKIYIDAFSERSVQTISKAIYIEDKLIGVVAIDVFIE